MIKWILLAFAVCTFSGLTGQTCTPWFPFEEGIEFEYTFYSKKDKESSRTYYTVDQVSKSGNNYQADITATMHLRKGEPQVLSFTVSCSNGIYTADLSDFMNPSFKESFGESEITITGSELQIPANLSTGQTLPDAETKMEAQVGPIKMKILMEVTNRKVGNKVSISTPVKSFDCYELTSRERVKVPLFDRTYNVTHYYAAGYGQVKSEYYDKKGNLDSYMLLTAFKK
ncbi:MAG: hypothetical protein OEQ53_11345 [Saprospiraceae bacterium]|nr:hypothetical protein [Saprospiraceae bacterium]